MLYIAADHAGFQLKKALVTYITKILELPVEDLGAKAFDEADDYPDFAFALAQKVAADPANMGILICGGGQGMCIAANKVPGVRAMLGYSIVSAEMGRKDDHANVLCLAGRVLSDDHARAIVKKFLETPYDTHERHLRRVGKITAFEK